MPLITRKGSYNLHQGNPRTVFEAFCTLTATGDALLDAHGLTPPPNVAAAAVAQPADAAGAGRRRSRQAPPSPAQGRQALYVARKISVFFAASHTPRGLCSRSRWFAHRHGSARWSRPFLAWPARFLSAARDSLVRVPARCCDPGLPARSPGLLETALEDPVDSFVGSVNSFHDSVTSLGDPP